MLLNRVVDLPQRGPQYVQGKGYDTRRRHVRLMITAATFRPFAVLQRAGAHTRAGRRIARHWKCYHRIFGTTWKAKMTLPKLKHYIARRMLVAMRERS
jgi:hypothetical protein